MKGARRHWRKMLAGVVIAGGLVTAACAAVDPVTVEVHYQNGVKYFKRGLYDKSIAEFEKTLSLDPNNAEAKAYLEKVKEFQTQQKPTAPAPSNDAQVKRLYAEGRQLYQERRYKEAQDAFSEILRLKPVDDFASYYREKCEIYISRQQAKEKKEAARRKAMLAREDAIASKKQAKRVRERDRQEMLAKRAVIKEEHRLKREEVKQETKVEETKPEEARVEEVTEAPPAPEEKAVTEAAAPVMSAREQRIAEKNKAREEKLQEKAEQQARARQKKAALAETKVVERQKTQEKKASAEEQNKARIEERRRIKDLFISGVEEYSRKDYDAAIASFRGVMDAEKKSGVRYSHSAQRLLNKALLRKKGIGEDRQIER